MSNEYWNRPSSKIVIQIFIYKYLNLCVISEESVHNFKHQENAKTYWWKLNENELLVACTLKRNSVLAKLYIFSMATQKIIQRSLFRVT
jgi:hypothetical protein